MHLFHTSLVFFCFISVLAEVVLGQINLEIIKNGIQTSALPLVRTRSGANLSLACEVVDKKNGKLLNDQIVWKNRGTMKSNVQDGANLSFFPITIKNQGEYLCVSRKYKLFKAVYVLVSRDESEFKKKTHLLRYPVGRRKRSNGKSGVGDYLLEDKYAKSDWNVDEFPSPDSGKTIDDSGTGDVKRVKIEAVNNNKNQSNFVLHHDGTTNIFRIALIVAFVFLAMLAIYHLIKCWRTGTLGMFNYRSSRVATPNNCQDTSESYQMTTCTIQTENSPRDTNSELVINGNAENVPNASNKNNDHPLPFNDALTLDNNLPLGAPPKHGWNVWDD